MPNPRPSDAEEGDCMIPYRLCCGKQHLGVECPDGKVLCCMCFERVEQSELNVLPDGTKENCCKRCAAKEKAMPGGER